MPNPERQPNWIKDTEVRFPTTGGPDVAGTKAGNPKEKEESSIERTARNEAFKDLFIKGQG